MYGLGSGEAALRLPVTALGSLHQREIEFLSSGGMQLAPEGEKLSQAAQISPGAPLWMGAARRLHPRGILADCGKRKLELKYFGFVGITKVFLNYKYNNRNLGKFCYLPSSRQVSSAFPMKS